MYYLMKRIIIYLNRKPLYYFFSKLILFFYIQSSKLISNLRYLNLLFYFFVYLFVICII
jgi:hypothetical protein